MNEAAAITGRCRGVASGMLSAKKARVSMMEVATYHVPRALFAIMMSCTIAPAAAKDLNVLVRITYAAFLAQQGAAMCNLPRLPLSSEDRMVFVNAHTYADWIKQTVSAGLSETEVQYILRSAADRAKDEMLQVTEVLRSYPPDGETAELLKWCTGKMKGIADQVVGTYARQPELIEQIIRKAKEN